MRLFNTLLIIILLGASLCYAGDIENLVQNPSFEFGVAPWTNWGEGGVPVQVEIDKKEAIKGDWSLVIDIINDGNGDRVELHQKPFNLEAGQELTYAMWAKAEDVRQARMVCNHRADPWTSYGSQDITIQKEWEEFWIPVTIAVNDNVVGIYVELRDGLEGKTWFDNFRFYEGDYVPDEEIGQQEKAVAAIEKLAVRWAKLKVN